MSVYHFYADQNADITVALEPWGSEYIVKKGTYLKVCTAGVSELVEIRIENGSLQIFFNGPDVDEDNTGIMSIV